MGGKAKRTAEKPPRAKALRFLYDTFHRFSVKIGIGVQAQGAKRPEERAKRELAFFYAFRL